METPIVIKSFDQIKCELFHENSDTAIGIIESEYSLLDVLVQIKEQKLDGYYIMFEGHKITISNEGRTQGRPNGFYDLTGKFLRQLI